MKNRNFWIITIILCLIPFIFGIDFTSAAYWIGYSFVAALILIGCLIFRSIYITRGKVWEAILWVFVYVVIFFVISYVLWQGMW